MTTLRIGFREEVFAAELARQVATPGIRPADVVERLLSQAIETSIRDADLALLKGPSVTVHSMYYKDRCSSLARMASDGYATWYIEARFSTRNPLEDIEIHAAEGLSLHPIDYGPAGKQIYRIHSKPLKTQVNHILRVNHLELSNALFSEAIRRLEAASLEQPYIANPRPGPRGGGFQHGIQGYEFVSFDHIGSGQRKFCSCAGKAHRKMISSAKAIEGRYAPNSWPHDVIRLLSDGQYEDGVCHLCVAKEAGPEAAAALYGDAVQEFVVPYIDQLMLTEGLDMRTARSEVQRRLGISRWVREAELYGLVKQIFPEHSVFREASPPWLGRQRLDVFIPSLKLALEHQGQQHSQAVSAFGGELALRRNLERDALKRRLCEENDVHLVEIHFHEALTLSGLRNRLRRYLQP
ncbi:hypothetical protein QA648_36885 (plasmid) [Rhizobium sp. CB3171]|uniref:hypothetical protein n=1 Tax=Rhizobium sp. CB3171 TaxID=3039157 RepID=UPI0024B254FF|nr:hypothetical protein [Rhizobium sp. CB3171]WFU07556.1 hypothetical protein QA648_36885 [Rhizobium sp. CB3171]